MNTKYGLVVIGVALLVLCAFVGVVSADDATGDIIIDDSVGDVPYDFIDLTQGTISANDSSLLVKINLTNIPDQLLFDKTNVTNNTVEYEWSLYIDMDSNPFTGSPYKPFSGAGPTVGTEYAISCMHFKNPGNIPHYDSLIHGTQHNVWEYNSTTNGWRSNQSFSVNASVDFDSNTLTMIATPLSSTMLNSSRFYLVTGYNTGGQSFKCDWAYPPTYTPYLTIRSYQDFEERKYVANGSFSSTPSDLTYRMRLKIDVISGQFIVPKVLIFNTTLIAFNRTYYHVDSYRSSPGNSVRFPDHLEWTGNNETVSSFFELGINELNTHELTPPFSSSRSVDKEVFSGNETITMTFNATPTANLNQLRITAFAEETDDANSELLGETATHPELISSSPEGGLLWRINNPVIGQSYSASVNLTVIPKTDLRTRYWPYLRVEGDYGSFINSSSGRNQSAVEYTDPLLGAVRVYFETPIDYSFNANGRGSYYERFKEFSEIVADGEPHTIGINNNAYEPGVRTVPLGTTVEWTNQEGLVHTVTSDTGLWDSGNLSKGQSFSYKFTELGTYPYHDALHPSVTGVVIVQKLKLIVCGDVNCNGAVNMGDVGALHNHVQYGYAICDTWIGDVNCDTKINMGDVGLLHNHVQYGHALSCCAS
ncbi:MAG: hypothetical protein EFT35_09995 [Methanophagales archaeon ANME-1-THS]|nr:MAG: hypothetical protein EFT35_09995 [Methanophagales archaeon ANME-1-THS]